MCDILTRNFKDFITEYQHGFVKGRSTVSNLLIFTNYARNVIESGFQVDCIYTDFRKAFDRVQHGIIIDKLHKLGIHSMMLRWINSYLTGRTQRVKMLGSLSRPINVRSGVPQGSHLGPLFFLLFVNDIVKVLKYSRCLLFADDIKIYAKIRDYLDAVRLQCDLNRLSKWCRINCLELNVQKCFNVTYSRKKKPLLVDYFIDGIKLDRKFKVKDLGVVFDTKVSFNDHIDFITARAYSILGLIKRNCWEMDNVYALKNVYCCLVRSVLEYASVVWNPNYEVHSNRIESIQKQFLLFALRKLGWRNRLELPSYDSRCRLINLESLRARRRKFCALYVFDLITMKIECPQLFSVLKINQHQRNLRTSRIFRLVRHRTNYGNYEPVNNMCRIFNSVQNVYQPGMSRRLFKKSLVFQ